MTKRIPGWERRLCKTVEAFRDRPFEWGRNDCCHFVSACVAAITGENPVRERFGPYRGEHGAREILKTQGSGTLYRTLVELFGNPVSAAGAVRGDIVYLVGERWPSIGICLGKDSVFVGEFLGRSGLVTLPTLKALKAFKI